MRLLAIVPVLMAVPIAASPVTPAKPICQNTAMQTVQGEHRAGVHPLNQEPPARAVRTVLRTIDGCSKPVLVSERLHGASEAPQSR